MSKSLKQQVLQEIRHREQLRKDRKVKTEEKSKEEERQKLWNFFEAILERNLCELKNYTGHIVDCSAAKEIFYFFELSSELGFEITEIKTSSKENYRFNVLKPMEGGKKTPAQHRLDKFNQQLEKAKKQMEKNIKSECQRVKQCIRENKYSDRRDGVYVIISVKTGYNINNEFEAGYVREFFDKLNLMFLGEFKRRRVRMWEFIIKIK